MAGTTATGQPSDPAAMQGRRGRYMVGPLLGRGGMAEVYAGHAIGSHGFQKPVAIKRLLPGLSTQQANVERLIEEAMLLVGMEHGNLVRVLDLERDGDDVFLVMELVDGPSLRQLIRARGRRGLPLPVATYIVQSAAAGLEFAHARAVIHADVSPSNLLLTTSGEVRVADFGIARVAGRSPGIIEGKWAYMAPEHARGAPLTPACDVFALGVVLYELVTGVHPFGRTGLYSDTAAHEITSRPVVPPSSVRSEIPAGIDAICMRAIAHDARDRYGQMHDLIDALVVERFANGWCEGASDLAHLIRTPEESPTGGQTGPRLRMARGSALQIQPALAPPAMVELAPPTTVDASPPRTSANSEARPARGARVLWWAFAMLGIAALATAIAIRLVPDDVDENVAAFERDAIVTFTPACPVEPAEPLLAPSDTVRESDRPRAPAPASRPARRARPRHVANVAPRVQPPPAVSTTPTSSEPTLDAPKKPHDKDHDLLPPE